MKKLYIANDPTEAHLIRSFLESEGIEAIVEGESLFGIRGGIPITSETSPSVWLLDDSQFEMAVELISQFRYGEKFSEAVDGWICRKCGEMNEEDSDKCLQCGEKKK